MLGLTKNKNYIILLLLCCVGQVQAQQHVRSVFEQFVSDKEVTPAYSIVKGLSLKELSNYKQHVVRYLSDSIFIVPYAVAMQLQNEHADLQIMSANDQWKFSPSLLSSDLKKNKNHSYIITSLHLQKTLQSIANQISFCKVEKIQPDIQTCIVSANRLFVDSFIAKLPEVIFIDHLEKPNMEQQISGYDRTISNGSAVDWLMPDANGKNIVVGVKEKNMDRNDIDIQQRIQSSALAEAQIDLHATSMATLIGGAGNSFYTGRGIAWQSKFLSSSFANLFADSSAYLLQQKITVQNHSYGTVVQPFYGAEALSYDLQTNQNKNLIHVFSSGNRGGDSAKQGIFANIKGYCNLTGNFKSAKNVITVAAVDTASRLASFSSAGPLYDGRLAPQISALGPNGTSDAAAIVSGACAMLQQVYADQNAQTMPAASLIKAVLYTAADDVGLPGIDYKSGYGLLNALQAAQIIKRRNYDAGLVSASTIYTKQIVLPSQAANFKITLNWTDTTATLNNAKAISNDLDLELVETTTGIVYKPWCLSTFPNKDSLAKPAIRKRDSLNTTEQITIAIPNAGAYTIRVQANQMLSATQAFHIAYSWDTLQQFVFTSPLQAADIISQEATTQKIRWRCYASDTNATVRFSVRYNNSTAWTSLGGNEKINAGQANVLFADVNAFAQLRAETSFGNFLSSVFVLQKKTEMKVDYFCTDSFRLSWNKHVDANQYQVWALAKDSAYLQPFRQVNDTFLRVQRTASSLLTYAVEAKRNDGLRAARSEAIQIENQGVKCFYISFNGSINIDKAQLFLEMRFLENIDSIVFEKVNVNGNRLRRLQKLQVQNGQYLFEGTDEQLLRGNNFYQAVFYFNNGTRQLSEIINLISSADQYIFLYPSPLRYGQAIQYVLKNSSEQHTFQIVNAQGAIVGNYAINFSGQIKLRLNAGFYFYRLFNANEQMIESGKFLIVN